MKTWIKKVQATTLGFLATGGVIAPSVILSNQKQSHTVLQKVNKSTLTIINEVDNSNTFYMWLGIGIGIGLLVIAIIIIAILLAKKKTNKNKGISPKIVYEESQQNNLLEQIPIYNKDYEQQVETINTTHSNHVSPSTIQKIIQRDNDESTKVAKTQYTKFQTVKQMTTNENIAKRVCDNNSPSTRTTALAGGAKRVNK